MTETLALGHIHRKRGEYLGSVCQPLVEEEKAQEREEELTLVQPFRSFQLRKNHRR